MSIKKITSKKKTQKKERKKKNTGQAYRVNQNIKKKKKQATPINQKKKKKKRQATSRINKQKKKGESNVNEAYIVHGHFRPKMMLNFSFQFSLNFWKKIFWCVWGENT